MIALSLQTQGAGSPRSSPSHTISRPIPMPVRSASACSTPTHTPQDSLTGVGGDVQEAFAQSKCLMILLLLCLVTTQWVTKAYWVSQLESTEIHHEYSREFQDLCQILAFMLFGQLCCFSFHISPSFGDCLIPLPLFFFPYFWYFFFIKRREISSLISHKNSQYRV